LWPIRLLRLCLLALLGLVPVALRLLGARLRPIWLRLLVFRLCLSGLRLLGRFLLLALPLLFALLFLLILLLLILAALSLRAERSSGREKQEHESCAHKSDWFHVRATSRLSSMVNWFTTPPVPSVRFLQVPAPCVRLTS
jgi:Zn-dependent protease with chaperone function